MKKTFTTLAILAVGAVSAHAQLTHGGYSQAAFVEDACSLLSSSRTGTATIGDPAAGDLSFNLTGLQNIHLPRSPADPSYSLQGLSFFSLNTGNTPVELQFEGTPGHRAEADGKIVVGGGALDGESSAGIVLTFSLYWFDDANNDDLYDPDLEEKQWVTEYARLSPGGRVGNGFLEYNSVFTPTSVRYVLAARSNYMVQFDTYVGGFNDSTSQVPPVTITHEYNSPYDGASINFHYTAVPEPATMAALGIGLAAILRRRRK